MALVKCLECGVEISDKAVSCIKCGCPINKKENENQEKERLTKNGGFYIFSIVAVVVAIGVIGMIAFLNRIPNGYTKGYYREAEKYVAQCEKYIENPIEENYPELGEYFVKIMNDVGAESTPYTAKDFALAEQQLNTSTKALFFHIGEGTEEEFREEIENMKVLMNLD